MICKEILDRCLKKNKFRRIQIRKRLKKKIEPDVNDLLFNKRAEDDETYYANYMIIHVL